jgi:flagellar secretion chaperone FliS
MEKKAYSSDEYLRTRVLTASAEQLQLMLYDGAVRFCEQARVAIEARQIEESFKALSRAQRIVLELCNSMKDEVAPEMCANMRRLYIFCYERLVDANIKKELKPLDEALGVLRDLRQTWVLLMEKLQTEKAAQMPAPASPPPDSEGLPREIGAALSCEG